MFGYTYHKIIIRKNNNHFIINIEVINETESLNMVEMCRCPSIEQNLPVHIRYTRAK